MATNFPSFSEGLSLRLLKHTKTQAANSWHFPSFSEGLSLRPPTLLSFWVTWGFPFLFGGTFIEAAGKDSVELRSADFPSFSEGLSLRPVLQDEAGQWMVTISLPFRRDFH